MAAADDNIFVIYKLNEKKENLLNANVLFSDYVGIASTEVSAYLTPCSIIDTKILERINEINALKTEIISISNEAFNFVSAIAINGRASCDSDEDEIIKGAPIRSFTFSGNTNVLESRTFIRSGDASTFSLENDLENWIGRGKTIVLECEKPPIGFGITFSPVPETIASAPVYPDRLRAWTFPQLENKVYTDQFYNTGQEYQTIITNANNFGIGASTVNFVNATYGGNLSGQPLGTYYEIDSLVPDEDIEKWSNFEVLTEQEEPTGKVVNKHKNRFAEMKNAINNNEQRIGILRQEVQQLCTAVTAIKDQKTDAQIREWESIRAIAINNETIDRINLAIYYVENIENI